MTAPGIEVRGLSLHFGHGLQNRLPAADKAKHEKDQKQKQKQEEEQDFLFCAHDILHKA